jgi:capping protein beta
MATADPLTLSLDLLRRLPPHRINENLETLITLCPSLAEELISSVDQPSVVKVDGSAQQREYLCCDYNRDGDSYRSPWSSVYDPPLDDGTQPPQRLRELEIRANEAFNTYRQLYYDGGLSSVYLWELDDGTAASASGAPAAFAGVVLFKKQLNVDDSQATRGCWDSLHVFEVSDKGRTATYELTSTIMLSLARSSTASPPQSSSLNLAGSLTRQAKADQPIRDSSSHISNVGRMIEEMEAKMRNQLQEVYFGKTKDIVGTLRSVDSLDKLQNAQNLQKELMGLWRK